VSGEVDVGAPSGGERPEGEAAAAPRPGPVRRLYDWVLHWAETPYGVPALSTLALAESSFFPIPPDPLLMALCLGAPAKSYRFALVATVASVVGGILGFAIGAYAWELLADPFYRWVPGVTPETFAEVKTLYDRWDFWAIFVAGLTPIPYKVFTISAGVFAIELPIFILASIVGRGLRFFVVAALIHRFGVPVSRFIDRYFNLLTLAFAALLVLGFLVLELVH